MFKVKVNIEDYVEELTSDVEEAVSVAVHRAAMLTRDSLINAANTTLSPMTSSKYIMGLRSPESLQEGKFKAVITLVGKIPNALESGFSSFDMKDGFLGSSKTKGTDKKYIDIPFRHQTPGTKGVAGRVMSREARNAMSKALKSGKSRLTKGAYPGITRGKRVSKGIIKEIGSPFNKYKGLKVAHKTGIEADMVAVTKQHKKSTQRQFFTFRRVSENSQINSWIHPGFEGIHLFPAASKELEIVAPEILKDALMEKGIKLSK